MCFFVFWSNKFLKDYVLIRLFEKEMDQKPYTSIIILLGNSIYNVMT